MKTAVKILEEKRDIISENIHKAESILSKYGIWKQTEGLIGQINYAKEELIELDRAIKILNESSTKPESETSQT